MFGGLNDIILFKNWTLFFFKDNLQPSPSHHYHPKFWRIWPTGRTLDEVKQRKGKSAIKAFVFFPLHGKLRALFGEVGRPFADINSFVCLPLFLLVLNFFVWLSLSLLTSSSLFVYPCFCSSISLCVCLVFMWSCIFKVFRFLKIFKNLSQNKWTSCNMV